MKAIQYILITGIIGLLCNACKKNDHQVYDAGQPYVNIWLGTNTTREDSVVYNFSLKPERPVDSIMFTARLMGLPAAVDRSFTLKAIGGDTTKIKEGVHYRFGTYMIKANNLTALCPVYILRTSDFADTTFSVSFGVAANSTLPAGVKEMQQLKILLRDKFQKPANWDVETSSAYQKLSNFFKTFSKVKFQFITTTTGVAPVYRVRYTGIPVPPDEIPYTQAQYYANTCKAALSTYNATHTTPLTDELGQVISF